MRIAGESRPAVVMVRALPGVSRTSAATTGHTRKASSRTRGAGVVIASDGLILTNEHVIRGAVAIIVTLPGGSETLAKQVVTDPHLDLAVLRIHRTGLRPLVLGKGTAESGTPVVAVSWADYGRSGRSSVGIVTSPAASLQDELDPTGRRRYGELIESTVELTPGFSGGPLFDLAGRLVGLNVAVAGEPDSAEYLGYAIPFNRRTREAVAQLCAQLAGGPTPPGDRAN